MGKARKKKRKKEENIQNFQDQLKIKYIFLISNKFIDIKKGTPKYIGSVQGVKQFKDKNYKNLGNQEKKKKMIGFAKQPTNH